MAFLCTEPGTNPWTASHITRPLPQGVLALSNQTHIAFKLTAWSLPPSFTAHPNQTSHYFHNMRTNLFGGFKDVRLVDDIQQNNLIINNNLIII